MPYPPIPEPLRHVLQSVLHANLFSTWATDLATWNATNPQHSRTLRQQIALCALSDVVDPEHFSRLTGHAVTDVVSAQAWFALVYTKYYGRPPRLNQMGTPE